MEVSPEREESGKEKGGLRRFQPIAVGRWVMPAERVGDAVRWVGDAVLCITGCGSAHPFGRDLVTQVPI